MEQLNVLYLSDNNYATYAGVSITSMFENNKHIESITVYLIDDQIDSANKEKFSELAKQYDREIVFLDVSNGIRRLRELGAPTYRNSYTTYLKLFAFNLLPDSVQRIFFIDSDSVVIGDLSEMIHINMQGNVIGAVKDGLSHSYKCMLGYAYDDSWYNMGVMLVDVALWKQMHCQEAVEKQLQKRNAYFAVDQDLLNITQHGKIMTLHPKYNATPHHYIYNEKDFYRAMPQGGFYEQNTMKEGQEQAVIRHFERFVGESPWHKNSVHPYTSLFDYYLEMSPWKGYRKQAANNSTILKIEKLLYKCLPKKVFIYIWAAAFKKYLKDCNKEFASNRNVTNIE